MTLKITIATLVLLSAAFACLSQPPTPGDGPEFSSVIYVDSGYTGGSYGLESAFSLHWSAAGNADHYEVRIYPSPINNSNWDNALFADSVAGGDSSVVNAMVYVQPEVFPNTCIECGQCVEACPQSAIHLIGGNAVIDLDKCTSCGECVRVCPVSAIADSRFGQTYYFGVKAVDADGNYSDVSCSAEAHRLRYFNDPTWCGNCAYECFILLDSCGPGCPVDAIWFTPDWETPGVDSGMVHIDYDLCINCGQCFIQCHEYGIWSLKKEVVPE